MDAQRCRSCGAAVVFAVTQAGRRQILDAEPSENGNVLLLRTGRCVTLTKQEIIDETANDHPHQLRLDHHVTCPQRAEWSRR